MYRRIYKKNFLSVLLSSILISNVYAAPQINDLATSNNPNKPNIIVIWGDDIGVANISSYTHGLVGYQTPNIDRIAKEGLRFTDYYAEQSSTAGRSTFITGQAVIRTGLAKVGMPGVNFGLRKEDITLAELLKNQGYATGQFGKNHLGDLDKHLPCNHGFQEFFGNLYHLNAEEEPEHRDYPTDPKFKERFGPRGVLSCTEGGKIVDTGPLTRKRMETIDDEVVAKSNDFLVRKAKEEKPFFLWVNTTGMHFRTHIKPEISGQSGKWLSEYADAMVEHDKRVGKILDQIDKLGIADNTIVIYGTDNGVHANSWPDAGNTYFRSEKNTNWEGAYRVPAMVRWPGHIEAGKVSNEIFSGLDWLPTLMAAAGNDNIKEELYNGTTINEVNYKIHLDGYNQLPYLTGKTDKSARNEFYYFNDDGQFVALRYNNWKFVFKEQEAQGTLKVWSYPFTSLRIPKIFNLRTDPFERADITSNTYYDWVLDHAFLVIPAYEGIEKFYSSFKEFPPYKKSSGASIEQVLMQLMNSGSK